MHIDRNGLVTENGKRLGWVDHYQMGRKWRGVRQGGESRGPFVTRAEAAAWVVSYV